MKIHFLLFSLLFVTFNLLSQNTAPVAVPDTVSIMSEDTITIRALQNDYDPDGDSFYLYHAYLPKHGIREYNDSLITYHSKYYHGADSLYYIIIDDGNPPKRSERAGIYIAVTENPHLPMAVNDTFTVLTQKPTALNLLANDFDPDGDQLTYNSDIEASHGTISEVTDSTLVFTSSPGVFWNAGITYSNVKKEGVKRYFSNEANAVITVIDNPDLPTVVTDEVSATTFIPLQVNPLLNDIDPSGYPLKIHSVSGTVSTTAEIISDTIIEIRTTLFSGSDTIYYQIQEFDALYNYISEPGIIVVHAVENHDIPVAVTDMATVVFNDTVSVNVLQNDYSPVGEPLEIDKVNFSTSSFTTTTINDSILELTNLFPPFSYDDSVHQITVEYRVKEKNNPDVYSKWGNINLTVTRNNTLPMGVNDFTTTIGGLSVQINLLQNDINPGQDSMMLLQQGVKSIVSDQSSYTAVLNDSTVEYTPYGDFSGIDTVRYYIYNKSTGGMGLPVGYGYLIVDVNSSSFYKSLDINNIRAGINANGYLFNNFGYHGTEETEILKSQNHGFFPAFEAPKGSGINAVFSASLWMGGKDNTDPDNPLHLAAVRYMQTGNDYWYGPVSNTYDRQYDVKWIGLWKLTLYDIKYHMNHYQDAGYVAKKEIMTWPGNGDVSNGEAAQLAPYYDKNNNGLYEPMQGDYPLIRGNEAIYFIYNDDRLPHSESQGKNLGIEVHGMAYAFNDEADSALWNTIFIHYDIYNRSDTTYYDTYVGQFVDSDLGNPSDDYIQSNVQLGAMLSYNGDDFDDNFKNFNTGLYSPGYGDKLPAIGITLLGGPFMDADNTDNPSGGCDESINGLNFGNGTVDDERWGMQFFGYLNNSGGPWSDPRIAPEYYNHLHGYTNNGNRWHSVNSTGQEYDFNYFFPGNSDTCYYGTGGIDPGIYSTEETGNNGSPNPPGDRRGVISSGPFTFKPGDVQQLDLAYVFARSYDSSNPLDIVTNRIISIRNSAIADSLMVLPDEIDAISENHNQPGLIHIWPNPASGYINIDCRTIGEPLYYQIYGITGVQVGSGRLNGNTVNHLQLTGLEHGIYIIHLKTNKGLYYGKFVKQ